MQGSVTLLPMDKLRNRFWPVLLLALGILIGLILLPGITAIKKTRALSEQFRQIQYQYDQNTQILNEMNGRLYTVSLTVRAFLQDSSPEANAEYQARFEANREALDEKATELRKTIRQKDLHIIDTISTRMTEYWKTVREVLEWDPKEKEERATFYLREQQRPHREDIQEITNNLMRLNRSNYQQQFARIDESQKQIRSDLENSIWLAVLLGVLVTIGSVIRIWQLEKKMAEHQKRLEDLSSDLIQAQEEERRMISRELHDELGQMVTGLKMELTALDRLRNADPNEFGAHLLEAKGLAERTLRTIRSLATGLRPSVLDLGLVPALHSLVRDISLRSGLDIQVSADGNLESVPEKYSVCLYRIAQEALNNCVKHANADRVRVNVTGKPNLVSFEIEDNGTGLVERNDSGFGLAGIEERVRELGGSIEINGIPGKGTRLKGVLVIA